MQRAMLCGVLVAMSLSVFGCATPVVSLHNTAVEVQKMVWINVATGGVGVGPSDCLQYLNRGEIESATVPLTVGPANPATQGVGGK
jgi:hypothetical protein